MPSNIEKAVILSAGMGKRLGIFSPDHPKGFIQFGQRPIVEESIEKLLSFNIKEIIIITGYLSHFYNDLLDKYRQIKTIFNKEYRSSGSMYSLYCAREFIDTDFLLLESDLIYESRAIGEVLQVPEQDVILISGYTNAGDEVFVETDGNKLINMSKDKSNLNNIIGEFVGISKVSCNLFREMARISEKKFKDTLMIDYEIDGFVETAKKSDIYCHRVEDLNWSEIDDYEHYVNAKENIYPKILLAKSKKQFIK